MTEVALTIGKFDGLHLGHQLLINDIVRASEENNYKSICYKLDFGSSGIFTNKESVSIIKGMGVDEVICPVFTPEYAAMSPEEFVKNILVDELNVRYLAVGSDFRYGKDRKGDADSLRDAGKVYGFHVNIYDKLYMDGDVVSSTRVRRALEEGSMDIAGKLMGHPYKITGQVESGKQLGRTLGYPTINLGFGEEKLLPKFGVYSGRVIIYNNAVSEYSCIMNIGRRPSIDDGDKVSVESFIYDFDGDIYGKEVEVIPDRFIREERRFDSIDELTSQIARDIEASKASV